MTFDLGMEKSHIGGWGRIKKKGDGLKKVGDIISTKQKM